MQNETVTLTLHVAEVALMAAMLKRSVDVAKKVCKDDDTPLDVRVGALVALVEGGKVLKKVIDALPDLPEGAANDHKQREPHTLHEAPAAVM